MQAYCNAEEEPCQEKISTQRKRVLTIFRAVSLLIGNHFGIARVRRVLRFLQTRAEAQKNDKQA